MASLKRMAEGVRATYMPASAAGRGLMKRGRFPQQLCDSSGLRGRLASVRPPVGLAKRGSASRGLAFCKARRQLYAPVGNQTGTHIPMYALKPRLKRPADT